MAKSFQVTLTLEGLHSQGGDPDLDSFVAAVRDFRDALKAIEKELSGDKAQLDIRVVHLSHSSPATITVEAFARPGARDIREPWVARVSQTLHSVVSGQDVETLPITVLKKVRQLSRGVGTKLAALRVSAAEEVLSLNLDTYQSTHRAIEDYRYYETAASGRLDTIDFHAGANRFVIYPTHGKPAKIACSFPPHLADFAHAAVRNRVAIIGKGKFRRDEHFPVLIMVEKIAQLMSDNDLPTLSELRGLNSNIIDDVPAEDFVSELRDAWG